MLLSARFGGRGPSCAAEFKVTGRVVSVSGRDTSAKCPEVPGGADPAEWRGCLSWAPVPLSEIGPFTGRRKVDGL